MIKLKVVQIGVALAILLLAMPAAAHKVSVFGYVEEGMILGEGYFPGGGKAKGCQVELLDSAGKVLAQTKTDDQGAFKLKLPKAAPPLKLVLIASMGHRGEYLLTAKDLGLGPTTPKNTNPATGKEGPAAQQQDKYAGAAAAVDAKELASIVGKAIDQKLAPLTAQVAKMNAQRQISVTDIIGGLGYILGLLGLAAYMKSRKQK